MAVNVSEDCVGCGSCVSTCPVEALTVGAAGVVEVSDECVECGSCVDSCPAEALSL